MRHIKMDWKFIWSAVGVSLALLVQFIAPFFVGRVAGHFWGFLLASINLVAYLWYGIRQPMAPSVRLIWIVGIGYFLFVAAFEWTHMSR